MIVADDPHACVGEVVGNGHCMRHVQITAGVPHSSQLRAGVLARGANLPPGTIIATFHDGRYANQTDGTSHIAILLDQDEEGLHVVDQWVGKPVSERVIRFKGGEGSPVNDGDCYHVVETDDA
jgi:hypothetical protein